MEKKTTYELIPMAEIKDEVRKIAVTWAESNGYDWIGDKHKLASDIQNYAESYAAQALAEREEQTIAFNGWISLDVKPEENTWYLCAALINGKYDILVQYFQWYPHGFIAYGEPRPDSRVTHYKNIPTPPNK